jgi:hypothetical protein
MLYFSELYGNIVKYNKIDDWYIWANMFKGKYSMTTFHSLDAYWPGLQVQLVYEGAHETDGRRKLFLLSATIQKVIFTLSFLLRHYMEILGMPQEL